MLALVGQPGSLGWVHTCEDMDSTNWSQLKKSDNLERGVGVQGRSGRSSGKEWGMNMNKCIIYTKSSEKNENYYILIFFKKNFPDFKRFCVLFISR